MAAPTYVIATFAFAAQPPLSGWIDTSNSSGPKYRLQYPSEPSPGLWTNNSSAQLIRVSDELAAFALGRDIPGDAWSDAESVDQEAGGGTLSQWTLVRRQLYMEPGGEPISGTVFPTLPRFLRINGRSVEIPYQESEAGLEHTFDEAQLGVAGLTSLYFSYYHDEWTVTYTIHMYGPALTPFGAYTVELITGAPPSEAFWTGFVNSEEIAS